MGAEPFLSAGQDFIQSALTKLWAFDIWLVALWNLVCISYFTGWIWREEFEKFSVETGKRLAGQNILVWYVLQYLRWKQSKF